MNKVINIILAVTLMLVVSCKEDSTLVCTIISPKEGQEFMIDEDIQVSVITDDKNSIVSSVLLYVDNKWFKSSYNFPFHFNIEAGDIFPGMHTIRVTAQNNAEKHVTTSVKIQVKTENESPDSVSFSNAQLPEEWKTLGWKINRKDGVDNQFSLFTHADNATVSTLKTCNYVEFYLKGYGIINLYLDKKKWQTINLGELIADEHKCQDWTKYEFECSEGFHIFKWEFKTDDGYNYFGVGLDAIVFKNNNK